MHFGKSTLGTFEILNNPGIPTAPQNTDSHPCTRPPSDVDGSSGLQLGIQTSEIEYMRENAISQPTCNNLELLEKLEMLTHLAIEMGNQFQQIIILVFAPVCFSRKECERTNHVYAAWVYCATLKEHFPGNIMPSEATATAKSTWNRNFRGLLFKNEYWWNQKCSKSWILKLADDSRKFSELCIYQNGAGPMLGLPGGSETF